MDTFKTRGSTLLQFGDNGQKNQKSWANRLWGGTDGGPVGYLISTMSMIRTFLFRTYEGFRLPNQRFISLIVCTTAG